MSNPDPNASPPIPSADAAWVTIDVPLSAQRAAAECRDLEALLRLNPFWVFEEWHQESADVFRARFRNESNQQDYDGTLRHEPGPGAGFTIHYDRGLKRRTVFLIDGNDSGCRLTVVDDYEGPSAEERAQRAAEVDRSMMAWGRALRRYFTWLKRWSWLPGWRWYLRRVWIPMRPSARRIVWLLYVITLAEFVVFLFVLLIYSIERTK